MNALSDALAVAQARTVQTLSRLFLASQIGSEELLEGLNAIGCTDVVEQGQLLACLDTLREAGASLGNGSSVKPAPDNEPASERQIAYIAKLADDKGYPAPDGPLTKAQASEVIDALQKGTYDPDKYASVPF